MIVWIARTIALLALVSSLAGCSGCFGSLDENIDPATGKLPESNCQNRCEDWPMWTVDNPQLPLPNGLGQADVNADGLPDYLTNYELSGAIRVALHPGFTSVRSPWPAVEIGRFGDAESSAFGDLDNDGRPDVLVARGQESENASGVTIIWGPPPAEAMNPEAWAPSSDLSCVNGAGQFTFIRCHDINKDGNLEVVVGGRGTDPRAGLKWLEGPLEAAARRDTAQWTSHDIDANIEGGYGFVFADFDGDGNEDIALCNSDWDTPEDRRMVVWYANPGPENRYAVWKPQEVYRSTNFYTKQQVAAADLDGDGRVDLLIQTDNDILFFRNAGGASIQWDLTTIPKPESAQWRSRPLHVVDLNQDGKLDLVGMLIHCEGYLPTDKAAAFWMERKDDAIGAASWDFHIIKHGGGYRGLGTYIGEKWDRVIFQDVDGDGDLDIVANCEEYNCWVDYGLAYLGLTETAKVYLSVVWFENR